MATISELYKYTSWYEGNGHTITLTSYIRCDDRLMIAVDWPGHLMVCKQTPAIMQVYSHGWSYVRENSQMKSPFPKPLTCSPDMLLI